MRTLQVVGLDDVGTSMVCKDPECGDRFLVPLDDRLVKAVRKAADRPARKQIEVETPMRPREIQARIRAGETVADVAAKSGMDEERIERFAYPVLLERARAAELAQKAHPVREDGPDVKSLGEVVTHAFGVRGQEYTEADWDAWRRDDGKWVVSVDWRTGHTDNRALWVYSPGAHGGTVHALDEHAEGLLNPEAPRSLRPVEREPEPEVQQVEEPTSSQADEAEEPEEPVVAATGSEPAADALFGPPAKKTPSSKSSKAKARPAVPAWEDVLLGVKSSRG